MATKTESVYSKVSERITKPFNIFLKTEQLSGLILIICTVLALLLTNFVLFDNYISFWATTLTIKFGDFGLSKYLSLSRNTVKKYIALYQLLNLNSEDINQKSDAELEELFSNSKTQQLTPRLKALYDFFPYMEKELKKTGITKMLMWEEYYKKHLREKYL